jgi:dihydrofolate reductase
MLESPDASVELHRGRPLELVQRLKAETGKDIWLCGGSKLAAAVVTEIDELILKINPVVIGAGIPLFDGFAGTRTARLVEHKSYSNGFVFARYALPSLGSSHAIDPR